MSRQAGARDLGACCTVGAVQRFTSGNTGSATLLVRAVDGILGTHTVAVSRNASTSSAPAVRSSRGGGEIVAIGSARSAGSTIRASTTHGSSSSRRTRRRAQGLPGGRGGLSGVAPRLVRGRRGGVHVGELPQQRELPRVLDPRPVAVGLVAAAAAAVGEPPDRPRVALGVADRQEHWVLLARRRHLPARRARVGVHGSCACSQSAARSKGAGRSSRTSSPWGDTA